MTFYKNTRVFISLTAAAICLLVMAGGCAVPSGEKPAEPQAPAVKEEPSKQPAKAEEEAAQPAAAEAVKLAMKFAPGDAATYRATNEAEKSVRFEGPVPDGEAFKGGRTTNRLEITFDQRVQSVDAKDNAITKVTIKELKYLTRIKDNTVLDFDSSRDKDASNPLAKLIGQSYTIEITPDGQVAVIETDRAEAAIRGGHSDNIRLAMSILDPNAIRERHSIPALPAADKNLLYKGGSWSKIRTFNLGLMGSKSYERIYTLKDVKEIDNHQIAEVEMNVIPASESGQNQMPADLKKRFDNTETYTGQLGLDLTAGKVQKYSERLQVQSVTTESSAEQKDANQPMVLIMGITNAYSLEKVD